MLGKAKRRMVEEHLRRRPYENGQEDRNELLIYISQRPLEKDIREKSTGEVNEPVDTLGT